MSVLALLNDNMRFSLSKTMRQVFPRYFQE